jgi:hypothetical protein
MTLPDFLIIGAARCGTSSMHRNLIIHPRIQGPKIIKGNQKEVHFFDKKYGRGIEYYTSCFAHKRPGCLMMESTPNYLFDPKVPILARKHLDGCKFIVMLRNPVDRAWSHFYHWQGKERWLLSILKDRNHVVVRKGLYAEQLKRWFRYFDRKQFLVIKSEDFYDDTRAVLKAVFVWLGVEPHVIARPAYYDPKRENLKKKRHYEGPPVDTLKWLYKFYAPHNQDLYDLMGWDFGW